MDSDKEAKSSSEPSARGLDTEGETAAAVDVDEAAIVQPAKRFKRNASGDHSDSDDSDEEDDTDYVFALDSSVSEEDFQKQFDVVKQVAESLSSPKTALVVYGDVAKTTPLDLTSAHLNEWLESKCRRMDLALKEAAANFSDSPSQGDRHVILITAGRQVSGAGNKEGDHELLLAASEELYSRNIKVIIVPVGMETDFKQLGLIVKRPQFVFPLSSFDDMTADTATSIISIINTPDVESYAMMKLCTFQKPRESDSWESISLCSDVVEGAYYMFYDDKKKPKKHEKVKRLIRESVDNFQSQLVTESKICISLAVVGAQGVGKSFFLNFILNLDLPVIHKVENGPLPSEYGGSQTPVPIHVKYGRNVQVLFHKQGKDTSPVVWFPEEELGTDTLERVKILLKTKFQERERLSGARCIELQGPFPVFRYLKERNMTRSGQLELDVDVELIDVPGYGDPTGDTSINVELTKADIVLFFGGGHQGRGVSAFDIAEIFRRHEDLEYTSRPKLVHLVKVTEPNMSSRNFDDLFREKKEALNEAWSSFLVHSSGEEDKLECYRDVQKKLPQLNGSALLEKMSEEMEVICFQPENPSFLESLKSVVTDHVKSVKMKQKIHPFLQNVQWAAKKLKQGIGQRISTKKNRSKATESNPVEKTVFEMLQYKNEASDLITHYINQGNLPLQSEDIRSVHRALYDDFLYSSDTLTFLWKMLKKSLEAFTGKLIANCCEVQDVFIDFKILAEFFCKSKVQQFFVNGSPDYLRPFLDKRKNRNPFESGKRRWLNASTEEKKELCQEFLRTLLNRTEEFLQDEPRKSQCKKSHFYLIKQLKEDANALLTIKSLGNVARRPADILKLLHEKLLIVIKFCNYSIREINPHPSLDVQANITLPEKMVLAQEDGAIPLQSSYEKVIKEMTELLSTTGTKGADAIQKLETNLKMKHGELDLRLSQNVDERLWAKALVNVLSDKDHFDVDLEPSLVLDHHDEEVMKLLSLAKKRLFAHQKSSVTCKIVKEHQIPENQIHLKKSILEDNCLEVLLSPKMTETLDKIRKEFRDPSHHLAPIFMPTIRPGPTVDIQGNYFLEEDPWGRRELTSGEDDTSEEESGRVIEELKRENSQESRLNLNVFLVVEPQHLPIFQTTINGLRQPTVNNTKLMYVVLPQNGRGIGVTRAIIKSLAENLKFSLYWTIDDDIQFVYQFDPNSRRWLKCSLTRGLLFGQRVFQTCREKSIRDLSLTERYKLFKEVTSDWPSFLINTEMRVNELLVDTKHFAEVQKNPDLLHSPFANISEDTGGDPAKEDVLKACERKFVDEARKRLFEDTLNHIAGVSIAHESTKRFDYTGKYPKADYMRSNQRYQVVLNNACALKGLNFVTDEMIFLDEEFQVNDENKRNTPYWGIRGEDKSFCRALDVSGVIGYQVIRIVHSHKKLRNVFDRIGRSYLPSVSPNRSEDEDDEDD